MTVALTLHGVRLDGSDHRLHDLRVVAADGARRIVSAPDAGYRGRRARYDMRPVRPGTRVTLHQSDGVDLPGVVVRGYGQRISLQMDAAEC